MKKTNVGISRESSLLIVELVELNDLYMWSYSSTSVAQAERLEQHLKVWLGEFPPRLNAQILHEALRCFMQVKNLDPGQVEILTE